MYYMNDKPGTWKANEKSRRSMRIKENGIHVLSSRSRSLSRSRLSERSDFFSSRRESSEVPALELLPVNAELVAPAASFSRIGDGRTAAPLSSSTNRPSITFSHLSFSLLSLFSFLVECFSAYFFMLYVLSLSLSILLIVTIKRLWEMFTDSQKLRFLTGFLFNELMNV